MENDYRLVGEDHPPILPTPEEYSQILAKYSKQERCIGYLRMEVENFISYLEGRISFDQPDSLEKFVHEHVKDVVNMILTQIIKAQDGSLADEYEEGEK